MNWAFIPLTIFVIILGFIGTGYYNTIQSLDEHQEAAAAEVINQYKRRADLITNLSNTVKGYSDHEQSIFTDIAASRAKLNQMQINPSDFQDPAKLEAFTEAQAALKSQLSRLLVIVEQYPDLKASALYQNLMVQLEGTENCLQCGLVWSKVIWSSNALNLPCEISLAIFNSEVNLIAAYPAGMLYTNLSLESQTSHFLGFRREG